MGPLVSYIIIITFVIATTSRREVTGVGLGGGDMLNLGSMGGFPGMDLVSSLPAVNSSSRWGDMQDDTLQMVLDHCKAARMCHTADLFSFTDSSCSQCHPCSCDDACYKRRDCCLDKQLRDARDQLVLGTESDLFQIPRMYGCHNTYLTQYDMAAHVLMVDTCPAAWKNEQVKDGCVSPYPNKTFSHWPVWSSVSSVVYRNADCARCNGEKLTMRWNLKVACDRSVYLKRGIDLVEAMRTALEDPTCQILFVPPRTAHTFPCRPVMGNYIDSCNITGQNHTYDQALSRACRAFEGHVTLAGTTYRNVFCAICNRDRPSAPGTCESDPPFPFFVEVNGSSLRDYSYDSSRPGDGEDHPCGCTDAEVYDQFEHQCRALQCSMTRHLQTDSGHCQSIITNSSGVFYDLALSLTPSTLAADGVSPKGLGVPEPVLLRGTGTLTRVARNIRTAFLLQGSHTTGWHVMTHMFRVVAETESVQGPEADPSGGVGSDTSSSSQSFGDQSTSISSQGVLRITRFKVHIKFCSKWPEPSEALEDRLFAMTGSVWNFSVDGPTKRSFQASPLYIAESEEEKNNFQQVTLLSSVGRVKEFMVDIPDVHIQSHGGELLETNYYLPISEVLKCPRVSFNLTRDNVSVAINKTSGSVHHFPSGKIIDYQFVAVGQDSEIYVCADQIFNGHGTDMIRTVPVSFLNAQLLTITIAFQAVSVCFLVIVLLTFVVFAELRTIAGKNLVGLVSTLILTIAMSGSSVFGVGTVGGCQVLGILSHFFMQSALTWAVIGSFHAYLLISNTPSQRWQTRCLSDARLFKKYVLFSFFVPAAVVGLTIVCELPDSRNSCVTDIGYGNGLCFVSSQNGLSAAASVSLLIILVTIVMCLWALWHLRRLTSNHCESFRQHFHHFTVQAVVTGLLGLASFLYMLALLKDMGILWNLTICLYSALVVLIFIAFFCKQRILKLWSTLLVTSVCVKRLRNAGPKFSPVET